MGNSVGILVTDLSVGMVLEIEGVRQQVRHIDVRGKQYLGEDAQPEQEELATELTMCNEEGEITKREFPFNLMLRLAFVEVFEPGIPKGFVSRKNFKKCYEDEAAKKVEIAANKPHAIGTRWAMLANDRQAYAAFRAGSVHVVRYNECDTPAKRCYVMTKERYGGDFTVPYDDFDNLFVPAERFIWKGSTWQAKRSVRMYYGTVKEGEHVTVYDVTADQATISVMNDRGGALGTCKAGGFLEDFRPIENKESVTAGEIRQQEATRDKLRVVGLLRRRRELEEAVKTLNYDVSKFSGDRLHHQLCPIGGASTGMKHSGAIGPCWCGAEDSSVVIVRDTSLAGLNQEVAKELTEAVEGGMGHGYKGHFAGSGPTVASPGHGSAPASNQAGMREK